MVMYVTFAIMANNQINSMTDFSNKTVFIESDAVRLTKRAHGKPTSAILSALVFCTHVRVVETHGDFCALCFEM